MFSTKERKILSQPKDERMTRSSSLYCSFRITKSHRTCTFFLKRKIIQIYVNQLVLENVYINRCAFYVELANLYLFSFLSFKCKCHNIGLKPIQYNKYIYKKSTIFNSKHILPRTSRRNSYF